MFKYLRESLYAISYTTLFSCYLLREYLRKASLLFKILVRMVPVIVISLKVEDWKSNKGKAMAI